MAVQRTEVRILSWLLAAYSIGCWAVTVWLVVARWPIVAADLQTAHPTAIGLLVLSGLMHMAVRLTGEPAMKRFWSGLCRFPARTTRLIRTAFDITEHVLLLIVVALVAVRIIAPETLTPDRLHVVFTAGFITLLAYPPIRFAALAVAGREALYVLRDDERELLAGEHPG